MAEQYDIVHVAVEDVRRGDALAMTSDDEPRPQVFYVAKVEVVQQMSTGEVARVVLTSEAVGRKSEPMVLEYPHGTLMRKIVGISSI
jgi:hypothetical protein